MSFIKIIIGNKKEKDTSCCSVQIVEVNEKENTVCCESEASNEQENCCVDEKEVKLSCCP